MLAFALGPVILACPSPQPASKSISRSMNASQVWPPSPTGAQGKQRKQCRPASACEIASVRIPDRPQWAAIQRSRQGSHIQGVSEWGRPSERASDHGKYDTMNAGSDDTLCAIRSICRAGFFKRHSPPHAACSTDIHRRIPTGYLWRRAGSLTCVRAHV